MDSSILSGGKRVSQFDFVIRAVFELSGASGLLPRYGCPRSDRPAADKVADLQLEQIAAKKNRRLDLREANAPSTYHPHGWRDGCNA